MAVERHDPKSSGGAVGGGSQGPPKVVYNWLSVVGFVLAAVGATSGIFFAVIGAWLGDGSGYSGLTFLPPLVLLVLGCGLVPAGALRETSRRTRGERPGFTSQWSVDLRKLTHTWGSLLFLAGTVGVTVFALGFGAGALEVVEYTESNVFCGTVCHDVMHPEYTAYGHSPHARIPCVECHVGSGADSYIGSKLSGLRQVYAVASGRVSRPIPTPIERQRCSSEMCESCHWRERFIDYKAISRTYFLDGYETEPVLLRMMLKIGGGANDLIAGSGIHYHMLVVRKLEYIARDDQRQDIAWVRVTRADGGTTVFENTSDPLEDDERQTLPVRVMECVDCHSRPAHDFISPVHSANGALKTGLIPADLPGIKVESVRALDGQYETTDEAMAEIADGLTAFYRENHPEVLEEMPEELEQAIAGLQKIYRRTIFPEMRASWLAHPNNIGHLESNGCFRCHNDEMESEDGETMETECATCHVVLAQGEDIAVAKADFEGGTAFNHPEDDEPFDEFTYCTDCHTGGIDLYE